MRIICRFTLECSVLLLSAIIVDDMLFAVTGQMRSYSIILNNDNTRSAWDLQVGDFVERTCPTCDGSHQTIVYRRLTNPGDIDFKNLFLQQVET